MTIGASVNMMMNRGIAKLKVQRANSSARTLEKILLKNPAQEHQQSTNSSSKSNRSKR
jgi:hypothetical protein